MSEDPRDRLSRRRVFAGAAGVGALAVAATAVPLAGQRLQPDTKLEPAPEKGGGYQVTQHVLRYYQTTKV